MRQIGSVEVLRSAPGEGTTDTASRLLSFVQHGDTLLAAEIVASFPRAVVRRAQIDVYLADQGRTRRLLGLVRAVMEYAYCTDPEEALHLWSPLRAILDDVLAADPATRGALGGHVRDTLRSAAAFAALQTGRFDQCLALSSDGLDPAPSGEPDRPPGPLLDTRYEALIRTFRIHEALAHRAAMPADDDDLTRRVVELDDMLDGLVPVDAEALVLAPQPNFSWFEETRRRVAGWVPHQRAATDALRGSFAALGLPEEDWSALEARFAEADRAISAVAAVVDDARLPRADRDDAIQRGLRAYSDAVREIQSPATSRARTLHDNRETLNYAAMVVALKAPTSGEQALAIDRATSARDWSDKVGDRYGAVMARWALGCLHECEGDKPRALGAFREVYARLVVLRSDLGGFAARSMLSKTFRTLVPRTALLALDLGDHDLAFEVLEFRRGLALTEGPPSVDARACRHPDATYFAVSVFADHGVLGSLATPDGGRRVSRIDVDPSDLVPLVARSCPDGWRGGVLRSDHSPRPALSRILAPLARARREGQLADGSHVCLALDHPVGAVPIQYLDLDGRMAVERFAFSRLASFREFERLGDVGPSRPRKASAIFIPTRDEAAPEANEGSFERSVAPLRAASMDLTLLGGIDADEDAVLGAMATGDVVHMHAHGVFPDVYPDEVVDPVSQAGILVAAEGSLPDRSDPTSPVLLMGRILACRALSATHVSLSTCVSGLGRQGHGGDMLGMEFALRARGVGSVIASHWYVPHAVAAGFFEVFYREWLEAGRGRGEAWRAAVLASIRDAPTPLEAASRAGAFSLHGGWT